MNPHSFVRGLLLFWSVWFSLVFGSNLADGLRHAGLLPSDWPFASGNFELVGESIAVYSLAEGWATALFGAVVLAQLTTAILFWRALVVRGPLEEGAGRRRILDAFASGIALFAAFLIADEIFVVYVRIPGLGTTHLLVFCALLLSLLAARASSDGSRVA